MAKVVKICSKLEDTVANGYLASVWGTPALYHRQKRVRLYASAHALAVHTNGVQCDY